MARTNAARFALPGAVLGLALWAAGAAAAHGGPAASGGAEANEPAPIRYDRDIRPILSDRCFKCHGRDGGSRQANLRLDLFDSATADHEHGKPIAPGDVASSELWKRVTSHDDTVRMPPATSNKRRLTDEELALIRRWIEQGAQYEEHWSFVAPTKPAVPAVRDAARVRNEIDGFVQAELERRRIAPNDEADPESLIRRTFLDLTGLPPTPEEIDAFLADTRPERFERWVDKLLTEEPYVSRYAERMAVPWLDAARYADTSGIHMDAGRSIWPYRDWVLRAFRDGMPFDRFVTEQLAGDLLPNASDEQKVASGFHRNHVTSDEGGAIDEEYKVEYAVDRTATTGSVFLGLTLGCARCHEHKFDPISQEEFYDLYSFFDSNEEPGIYSQVPDNRRALEPFMEVPSAEQRSERERLTAEIAARKAELDVPGPGEADERAAFDRLLAEEFHWASSELVAASSSDGATLTIQPDGSALASGASPDVDDHLFELRTDATDLRLVLLEALTDPSLPMGRVGRAPNGNAVLSSVDAQARSIADPAQTRDVRFAWVWADHEQSDGNFRVVNVLDGDDGDGWAVGAHQKEGPRAALLLAEEPFGFEGGTTLTVRLRYRTGYTQHVLGHVRLRLGSVDDAGLARLPLASSGWFHAGPYGGERDKLFAAEFGPEHESSIDRAKDLGGFKWRFDASYVDAKLVALADGVNVHYLAKDVYAPSTREIEVSLGSDDGVRVFLDGREVHSNPIDRGLAADQDKARFEVPRGRHTLVFKVVNTGGQAGFYWRELPGEGELARALVATALPSDATWDELKLRADREWRAAFSPAYRERVEAVAALEKSQATLVASIPRTMVMKELATPRETYLLKRGVYDQPDKSKPAKRAVPAALGKLPADAPANRLGLAEWLISADNPLVARVTVNRVWEWILGTGIVRTSEDFGMQGEWPSHPELLDWLAVDFREHGWDLKRLVKQIVTSATYRRSSRARPDLREVDPDNRWLAFFPRRRMAAEFVRDQALYVSGLLVERFGGPSVKPYQPEGLWQEVAMIQSNTRIYERGMGEDLWRRSLYTYWKRACPPPSMLTFDAPTREFCTIRRTQTNTPLQALVLWNDEQFVEAARVFAQRSLVEEKSDEARLQRMFRRCAGRRATTEELALLESALEDFRTRYEAAPDEARKLIEVGQAARASDMNSAELAAWTMLASSLLNLDATICRS